MLAAPSTDLAACAELDRLLEALGCAPRGEAGMAETLRRLREELPARLSTPPRLLGTKDDATRSETRYRDLFKAIDEGFCTIEVLFDDAGRAIDYRFLEINPAFEKHTGLTGAMGKRMRELAPDHDEHWFQIYGRVALTGEAVRFENHSAPLARWFNVYAFRVGRPEQRQVAILFSDSTQRKTAEAALRESEERFRAVADNIPQLAWMTDARGRMLWFNRRWSDYTGLGLEAMQEAGWPAVHDPAHPEPVGESWIRALETGEPWEATFPLRGRDGGFRWFLSRAFPIRDEQGNISRWFGTNTDIGHLRETEEALKTAHNELRSRAANLETVVAERTAALRETVQELEVFSYSLIHDLRAPLRAMCGFSEILENDYGERLDDEGRGYLRRIAAAGRRLDQLIQDVLAYSRVLHEDVSLCVVEPEALVTALIEENPALRPPRAEIVLERPLHPVLGHEAYLMQVLSNLVYNAVKFVPAGRKPRVRIWTETEAAHVRVCIRDNGIGFPPGAEKRLFGMFQRFHLGMTYEGTGMGLAIVRKAAERMGGAVELASTGDEGSTFVVRLRRPT